MNRELLKEKIPHGDNLFPLEVHIIETDIHRNERLNCHWHEDFEFLIVTEGGADFHVDDSTHRILAGELLFVNSNSLHSATAIADMPCCFFAIVFHPSFLTGFSNDGIQQKYFDSIIDKKHTFPSHITPSEPLGNTLIALLTEIKEAYVQKYATYELFIKMKLYEIWYLMYSNLNFKEKNIRPDSYRIARIKSILAYMQSNFSKELSLENLADHFHMSTGYFCKFFKSMVKMSATTYLNSYRINKSVSLLEETDKEISEIAGLCGFNNISYYNKIFRRYMHCTPSEYRREAED
jgi:AraC-like DNA-binding protein/quercetin dioxygenase-like cupin family protein